MLGFKPNRPSLCAQGKRLMSRMAAIDDGLSFYRAQAVSEAKALPFASMTRTSLDFHS
jgi:hypothetical protein